MSVSSISPISPIARRASAGVRAALAALAATVRLGGVARAQGNAAVARLAERLQAHARSEEELLYPAAVLVGDLVRARVPAGAAH